jgi:hypothetical protein
LANIVGDTDGYGSAGECAALDRSEEVPLHLRKASSNLDWKLRFRIIAAKASRQNKHPEVYSSSEAPIRDELIRLGFEEGVTFFHEHRVLGYRGKRGQNVYFWLDIFIPALLLDLEADGEIWHQFPEMKARDRRRDAILRRNYGICVARLNSYHIRKKRLNAVLKRLIARRRKAMPFDHSISLPSPCGDGR